MSRADEWGEVEPDVPAIPTTETTQPSPAKPWPAWAQTFLDLFAQSGNVMLSARGAGVDRTTPYRFRNEDERFRVAWEEADEASTQVLEAEARRRAMAQSDRLLVFLLKARRPATYRENYRVEHVGDGGGPIQTAAVVPPDLDDHERAALRRAIDAVLAAEADVEAG